MILTLDIGNTNIKCAVFEGDAMLHTWRVSTVRHKTSAEFGIQLNMFLQYNGYGRKDIDGIIVSSVVPSINFTIEHMCRSYIGVEPKFLAPGVKTGLNIKYENPRELGSDRIANAVAASALYGGPCIVIDFGSATNYGAISEKGDFLGGAISPGIKMSAEALYTGTAKLPRIELVCPQSIIARTTVTNIQAGVIHGYVGSVEHIVRTMRREMGCPNARVIATGGMARIVAAESDIIDVIDSTLTLKGIRIIYERNQAL